MSLRIKTRTWLSPILFKLFFSRYKSLHCWERYRDLPLIEFRNKVLFGDRVFMSPIYENMISRSFPISTPEWFFSGSTSTRTSEDYARIFFCWALYHSMDPHEIIYKDRGETPQFITIIKDGETYIPCYSSLIEKRFFSLDEAIWEVAVFDGKSDRHLTCYEYFPKKESPI